MTQYDTQPGMRRKLTLIVLGLAALVTTMLCAFALPSLHSGPHHVPVGVAGSHKFVESLRTNAGGDAWDVHVYETSDALQSAVRDRDIAGGLALGADIVQVYTASAGAPSATGALTALGNGVATQLKTEAAVHDLVPFTADDPQGAGMNAALLPLIFGGIFPALILGNIFPGHRGLRTRLAGVLLFSVVAGAAIAAVLQFGTGSIDGEYGLTALGIILSITALSTTLLGLQARFGVAGFAGGGALMMLLGNPLSGLAAGPHWLPDGWAGFGQLLPPGAAGSLLRANGFFGGTGGGLSAIVLTLWVVFGVALVLRADQRGRKALATSPERVTAVQPEPVGV